MFDYLNVVYYIARNNKLFSDSESVLNAKLGLEVRQECSNKNDARTLFRAYQM
jgi:hypothetical protein